MYIDLSGYSEDELFQTLESIDDIQHPEQALLILKALIAKTGLSQIQLLNSFKNGTLLDVAGALPFISPIASDIMNSNLDTVDKLKRLFARM